MWRRFCFLSEANAGGLLRAIAAHETLTSVDLSCNDFGPDGALAIASCVRRSSVLRVADVSGNPLGDEGVGAILDELERHASLSSIGDAARVLCGPAVRARYEGVLRRARIAAAEGVAGAHASPVWRQQQRVCVDIPFAGAVTALVVPAAWTGVTQLMLCVGVAAGEGSTGA